MKEKLTAIELFAGSGGLALGLERAGIESVALVEIDKFAVETLRMNRPEWNVIHKDIAEVDFTKLNADIVTGGFPCQSFSYAGKRLGFEDTRGTLFFEFARCIKEVKPKLFIGENVSGLVKHDKGRTLQIMIDVLENMGYNVQYKILNAAYYGVPQKRKRVFIIGTLPGHTFMYPEPEKKNDSTKRMVD